MSVEKKKCRYSAFVPKTGPQTVVIGYTDDQNGKDIREKDVIRAANGKWYTQDELDKFRDKSSANCPTYGNCNCCYASGPVGRPCASCQTKEYSISKGTYYKFYFDAKSISTTMK